MSLIMVVKREEYRITLFEYKTIPFRWVATMKLFWSLRAKSEQPPPTNGCLLRSLRRKVLRASLVICLCSVTFFSFFSRDFCFVGLVVIWLYPLAT